MKTQYRGTMGLIFRRYNIILERANLSSQIMGGRMTKVSDISKRKLCPAAKSLAHIYIMVPVILVSFAFLNNSFCGCSEVLRQWFTSQLPTNYIQWGMGDTLQPRQEIVSRGRVIGVPGNFTECSKCFCVV